MNRKRMKIYHIKGIKKKQFQAGMVLILTLWILAILSFLLLTLFVSLNLNTKLAFAVKHEAEGEAIGRGAVYAVAGELRKLHEKVDKAADKTKDAIQKDASARKASEALMRGDELGFYLVKPREWKISRCDDESYSSGENWTVEDYAICYITSEDSKAQVNSFKETNWLRIPGVARDMASAIMKFIKGKGKKLSCIEELLELKEIQDDIYDGGGDICGLKNCLTTFSGAKLYINKASAAAIAATLDIDISKAASIEDAVKNRHYFTSMQDVGTATGVDARTLEGKISLTCRAYRIKAYVVSGGHVRKLEAVVIFSDNNSFNFTYMGSA
ncbi:MAG: hypothetical protein A2017_11690 [Lentisphaerae bacterium GWF2_44_16]|nr:MAG: hypothetical protein A2017_11690 [Lentisphaerae bacterium GWF2_44_16]